MTEQEAKHFLCGFFDAFNRQDFDRLFQTFICESCKFINGNGVHQGKKEMLNFWHPYFEKVQETLHEPFNIFVKDNQIATEVPLTFLFKQSQNFAGHYFEAGETLRLRTADFYQLSHGKIIQFTVYRFSPWGFSLWEDSWDKFENLVTNTVLEK